jgi:hypothetical protein
VRSRGISLNTVRSETSIPSLSSSPWTRGAPHNGLAIAVLRMSARTSAEVLLRSLRPRPLRDFQRQNSLEPSRCQRITVSGFTITMTSRHLLHRRESAAQNRRSDGRKVGRVPRWRSVASC